jgi:hypothetical protein
MQGVKDVEKVESNNIDTNSLVCNRFEINEYEKKANSLIGEILGGNINPKMTTDTLKKEEVIFVELKNTPLSQLATENEIIKYTFSLTGKYSLLKHHFIRIICKDEIVADTIFSVFEKIALEKSGVPGLTYSSDYLVNISNEIYWINSNCSYSFQNHLRFVEIFKAIKQISDVKAIECECGKVRCITSDR